MLGRKSSIKKVCIVIPAYNEEKVIAQVIDAANDHLSKSKKFKHTLVVVDDGSKDLTAEIVSKKRNTVLIKHIINAGAGAATRTGIHYAISENYNYVATMDADGQHSPEDVARVLKEVMLGQHDFIIGSRLIGGGNMPFHKTFGNKVLGIVTYILLGVYASDTQSGLKALSIPAASKFNFHSNNYAFCSEMIWRAHQAGLSIYEVPIESIYTEYSVSRGQKNISGAFRITWNLIKRRFEELING